MRWRLNWPSTLHLLERALHAADRRRRRCATGAPQSAMMPSPMNLSSVPSYLKIVSTISSKYSLSISTMTSAVGAFAHAREAADVAS